MSVAAVQTPAGFEPFARVTRWGGSIELLVRAEPAVLWVRPRGYVGPALLRAELEQAERFGALRTGGWSYVVDTSGVRVAHPLNPLWLRKIHRLPNLSGYYVVAPALPVRLALRALSPLVRPDAIVARPEALAIPGLDVS